MSYRSVESKIRDVLEGLQAKHLLGKESDQNDHCNDLKKYFKDETKEVDPDYHPVDDPRFHSPPSGNKPDPIAGPQGDRDVDNVKKYLIKRSQAAQRKLKLIDND